MIDPCPICGQTTPEVVHHGNCFFVQCVDPHCGTEGPKVPDTYGAEAVAIGKWNQRPAATAIGAAPDQVHAHPEEEEMPNQPTRDQLIAELALARAQAQMYREQAFLHAEANRQAMEQAADQRP